MLSSNLLEQLGFNLEECEVNYIVVLLDDTDDPRHFMERLAS
jgi:hypothetical protein